MTLSRDTYGSHRLYLSPPEMTGAELPYVQDVFRSNWIAPLGPMVDAFEREFAAVVGAKYAAAVASGTAALHLALRILNVGPGDTVICSSFTFCASVNPIIYLGAEPVLIDSDDESWNMDPALLETELRASASSGTLPKAVVVVHLYGQTADMNRILAVCGEYNVPVIEDAAEALGAGYRGRPAGSMGVMSIFSFNGNKIITTSGGGMLVSDNTGYIEKARFLATQARDPAPHYQHSEIGYNYRMSNVLAAIGRGQLTGLADKIERRRSVFMKYRALLADFPGIGFMPEPRWSRGNRWLTCITIDSERFGADREMVRNRLEQYNIESRPLWKPMHMQPAYCNYRMVGGHVSESLFGKGLCLPSGSAMSSDDIGFVCGVIGEVYAEHMDVSLGRVGSLRR